MRETIRLHWTDEALLDGLASGSDAALNQLYQRYFPMTLHLILSNNGSEDDAKDIFQEALVVLYERAQDETFALSAQLKTYLYSVCRRLWLKQLSRRGRFGSLAADELNESDELLSTDEDLTEHERRNEQFDLMAASLAKLGEPCRTLLEDFYIRQLSMQDITEKFGYTNTDNAKTQKYKCLMRLKRLFFSDYQE
ncbi:sigma-70 family RNA polymerase sigma factor [Rudanella paleaurantiibacter]|uniref:Sigma-70 family RNA polymerase sigma factor n=1 Tax=Rudanella paleaurantiibacter TaxID=2614655 RepID=A0A7J5U3J0_9BACT|nr:sigma-70 family RNA polymerase sigma factor [Rudanella paleaurantiibacter]KAB7732062.1 sigma-70 family RNA polymerase sigma factor [Rudanella paleaurantiibacter]